MYRDRETRRRRVRRGTRSPATARRFRCSTGSPRAGRAALASRHPASRSPS